jgi:MFS family permease
MARLTSGGDWALTLPKHARRNLRWFWFDGLFASASDNIVITYLILYVLALGATRAQIGMLSSLTSLTAALLLLPGAVLVERLGHRRQITTWSGGIMARSMLLALALIPLLLGGQALIYAAIALALLREAFGNLAFPAWMSLTADIVPIQGRGRYFGSRNFVMGIAGMLVILLVGTMITRAGQPTGYQLALGLAFLLGMVSTYSFAHIRDPQAGQAQPPSASLALPVLLRDLRANPAFLTLALTAALWNFSLNIAGPFFNVYLVQNLKATATMVALTSIASSLSSLVFQRKLGELADRWGPRRLQLLSSFLIPVLPLLWILARAGWNIILINILGGLLWGAYNLASFNFLLILTPAEQRARFSALYQVIVTLSLAAGAAVGSFVVTQWGYIAIFICSALGRWTAAFLYARFVNPSIPSADAS